MSNPKPYRKKPVVIEASDPLAQTNAEEIALWCGARIVRMNFGGGTSVVVGLSITTLEGEMTADLGDRIIKGVAGEFYPCKPDIFDATYEPA